MSNGAGTGLPGWKRLLVKLRRSLPLTPCSGCYCKYRLSWACTLSMFTGSFKSVLDGCFELLVDKRGFDRCRSNERNLDSSASVFSSLVSGPGPSRLKLSLLCMMSYKSSLFLSGVGVASLGGICFILLLLRVAPLFGVSKRLLVSRRSRKLNCSRF